MPIRPRRAAVRPLTALAALAACAACADPATAPDAHPGAGPRRAALSTADYTVQDDASCTAFLADIGATGFAASSQCYVQQGTLPAGSTLTIAGGYGLRPSGNFRNDGTINANGPESDFGALYNGGTLDNYGSINVNVYAQNYATINNYGTITIAADFYNGSASFTVKCGGTLAFVGAGRITGTAPQVEECTPKVTYAFGGFLAPVGAAPAVNVAKAGSAIPVKFSLGADYGLAIFNPGYPKFTSTTCGTGTQAPVESTVADTRSGLTYDAANGVYTYVWKTDKSLAGRCGTLDLGLADGSSASAKFQFSR